MKKLKLVTAIVAIVVVAGTVFYACKKDVIQKEQAIERNVMKSTGNYQQPTQIVDINTFITVGTVRYLVVGNAVVGNYNGQIYECNVEWKMRVANEDFSMFLNAKLKPEYHDITTFVAPVMENYIITVTNPNMVTDESNANLWAKMVDIVIDNVVIEDMILHGINIAEMAEQDSYLRYQATVDTYSEDLCVFTEGELARISELSRLMQIAIDNNNTDLALAYSDEIMHIYYNCNGREHFDRFKLESSQFLLEMCEVNPIFASLDDRGKVEVLEACYKSIVRSKL